MKGYIADIVDELVSKYGERNPFSLCKAMDIEILPFYFESDIKGYTTMHFGITVIVLNGNLKPVMKKIVCAHELAHSLLHKEMVENGKLLSDISVLDMTAKPEVEANLFASELLISDEDILDLLKYDDNYFSIAKELRVPPQLLDFKIRMLQYKGHKLNDFVNCKGDFLKS